MRAYVALLLLLGAVPAPGWAAPRVAVWLPAGTAPATVQRAFGWAQPLVMLEAAGLEQRFPPSPAARARAAAEERLQRDLETAEQSFVATDFAAAAAALGRVTAQLDRLPPSARTHRVWVRARLLRGRIDLAAGRTAAATAAFTAAAGAAPELQLDEAEYPPDVIRAFAAARQQWLQAPPRTLTVASDPPGADVELNGRLWGRAPTRLRLPPGHCRLLITRPGYEPVVAPCGTAPTLTAHLRPASRAVLHDQIRERLRSDPRWFLDLPLLDAVGTEAGVHWVVTLERGRGEALEARLYSVRRHAFRPLQPARYGIGELAELGAQVRAAIEDAEGLAVRVIDPLTRAPLLDARAGDPATIARAVAFVRRRGEPRYRRLELPRTDAGFAHALPTTVLGARGAPLDLEYYVEGYGADGGLRSRVGSAADPQRFTRAALPVTGATSRPAPAGPGWYTRWYVWAGVAAVVLGVTLGTYYAVRPTDVSFIFAVRR